MTMTDMDLSGARPRPESKFVNPKQSSFGKSKRFSIPSKFFSPTFIKIQNYPSPKLTITLERKKF